MTKQPKIVVVGGGMTGLAAAYTLQKENPNFDITLLEASHRLGGKIQTVKREGFVIERGPDSFLSRKPSMGVLAKELGIDDQLVRNATGQAYVLVEKELHPIPGGSIMGVPTEIAPFITSGLFSWTGKMRAAGDFILPRSHSEQDQSLGHFFRRRFGGEVVENLIEPLLSGIYAGDIDKLSLQATFPQFLAIEQKHRSLILGMKQSPSSPKPSGKKQGLFQTFSGGLETIVDAPEKSFQPGMVQKNVRLDAIERLPNEQLLLKLNNGKTTQADELIFAIPHLNVQPIFEPYGLMTDFKEMPATSVATVAMAFREGDVEQSKDGTGFVVSRNSDYAITACTWTHKKWPQTTPEGYILIRSYVGRAGDESVVELSGSEIERVVISDLQKTTRISGEPLFTIVTRWKEAMPQYTVGHKDRVKSMQKEISEEFPMVQVTGSSFEGLGLPDCIDQGKAAAMKIIEKYKVGQTI